MENLGKGLERQGSQMPRDFHALLSWHLNNGTRPQGGPDRSGIPWGNKAFAHAVGATERSVRNWRNGSNLPSSLNAIEREFFGDNRTYERWRQKLREAFGRKGKSSSTSSNDHRLTVGNIENIINLGWDGAELLRSLIALDYRVIAGLKVDHEGEVDQWVPVFMNHPQTWRVVFDMEMTIVGYWHFVPLCSSYFQTAQEGRLLDSEITIEKLEFFELPGWYDIYFVTLELLPQYRNPRGFGLLFSSLIDVISELAVDKIFIRNICTNAYTVKSISLCRALGLTRTGPHTAAGGDVYEGSFETVVQRLPFQGGETLARVYNQVWKTKMDG